MRLEVAAATDVADLGEIGEDRLEKDGRAAGKELVDRIEGWQGRSGSGYVIDAFWSAWDALAGARDYRETIERAVRHGNDTDTTACIAGALAGLHWGVDAIPADWLRRMRGRDIVEPLVGRLTALT